MRKIILAITCCIVFTAVALAQTGNESGSPSVINYTPKEFDGGSQSWAIAQGANGIMYFGNNSGVLEFDGVEWKLHELPNKSIVRSIAIDDSGKIYIGGQGELGYFQPDAAGKLTFHSLVNFIPKANRDFSDVFNTYINKGKVYFRAVNYLFTWNIKKKHFTILSSNNGFHQMFLVNGKTYIREWNKGLEVLQNDHLSLVKGGEQFSNERIYVMLPFPGEPGTILIGTRTMGLLKYDGQNFVPFKTEADQFIKDNLIYLPGAILPDTTILLNTLNGAVVIDSTGKMLHQYNAETGIINNQIYFTFVDQSGATWLATANGISRIDNSSPVTYFDKRNNFNTISLDFVRYNGVVYAATNNGAYFLNSRASSFQAIKNSKSQTFQFLNTGADLLVVTSDGLFKVEKDQLIPVRKSVNSEYAGTVLKRSVLDTDRVYVGTSSGLWSVRRKGNGWIDEGQILAVTDQPTSMEEDEGGSIWFATRASGLYRIQFRKYDHGNTILKDPVIEHFDQKNGLQNGSIQALKINKVDYFVADSIYRFNENKKLFYSDTSDKVISSVYKILQNKPLTGLFQDKLGRIWLSTKRKLYMGSFKPDGSLTWVSAPFNQFSDESISFVYAEKNGITWLGTGSSIVRYDFNKKSSNSTAFSALVRQVTIGADSTIFFGNKPDQLIATQINYENNSIKFRYAATSFEGKNSNRFKTMLEGLDKNWSAWSNETTKEYTNLSPGKYTFKVKAINMAGIESPVDTYSFEVLPPWYRTWWAYSLYAIAFVLLLYGFVRLQKKKVMVKERQRSQIREAELKAGAENERRKNIELISEMGKDITASLSIENIINTVYVHVNKLMDAPVFGIGIYHKEKNKLEFPATKEKDETLPSYSYGLDDKTRPACWCFKNQKEIVMNDLQKEHQSYISDIPEAAAGENAESMIYLPLINKGKAIGVITAQSFGKNAYTEFHLNILRSLATYTAVALDNADAYDALKSTQKQLIQSEKMASLGELTAGIAHEIQNPLNFVNNFSEVNSELLEELKDEIDKGNIDEVKAIANVVIENEQKINHHGKRADAIVKGMLQHSRSSTGQKEPTDINSIADEYFRLSYHGLRAKDKSFNASLKSDFDDSIGKINLIPQDIGRVILNLFNNAFYAVGEKQKLNSLANGEKYKPAVSITTKKIDGHIAIHIKDNGNGIPPNVVDKIFQPFFTTKPTGEGTGLGLSLAYDIIKAHEGELKVETKEGEGSEFIIQLPIV
jgi:signal transduction histidine kinase